MQKIIAIRGPLGVGKTTIAKILAEKISAKYLSLDKILTENNLDNANGGIPLENFLKANEIIYQMVKNSDKTFVIDGCFYYQEQVNDLIEKFRDNIIFFTLMSSVERCIERDAQRELVYGKDSAEYVHCLTSAIKAGFEINNENLSVRATINKIVEKLN